MSRSKENLQMPSNHGLEKMPKINLVASSSGVIPHGALNHVVPLKRLRSRKSDQIVVFLLKVAALEAVRRLSKARCPIVWRVVQALQVLVCPPFKWLQRWGPLGALVKAIQKFSRPFLCLSIATAFFDHSETPERRENTADDSQQHSQVDSGMDSDSNEKPNSAMSKCAESDDTSERTVSENWVQTVLRELDKEGISLPERINEDELQRFYIASKGDLSCLLSSLKRTIRWRETYYLHSPQELENLSSLVFWHGFDLMLRPCLVIRLGLACFRLSPQDRPLISQAVVSQMEYGVLHLINEVDPRITVLMDCEGLSPMRFPMQMMKSCATILQDHYPNRLAILFIVRLTPVSRVITQTFMKVLKPATQQKVRIEGETYSKVLPEFLQNVPAFLGGKCTCSKCVMVHSAKTRVCTMDETSVQGINNESLSNEREMDGDDYPPTENLFSQNCKHHLRIAVIGILLLWIIVALIAGMYDPSSAVLP